MKEVYDPRISPGDLRTGKLLSIGSKIANRTLVVSDYLGLTNKTSLRLDWNLGHEPSDLGILGRWITFTPATGAGRLTSNYPEVGILNLSKAALTKNLELYKGVPAICYALGRTAIMVGTSKADELFGQSQEDPDTVSVAMRIGKGNLHAKIAVITHDGKLVSIMETASQGPRLAIGELPSHIPLA